MQFKLSKENLLKALGVLVLIVIFWKLTKGLILIGLIGAIVWIVYKLVKGDF